MNASKIKTMKHSFVKYLVFTGIVLLSLSCSNNETQDTPGREESGQPAGTVSFTPEQLENSGIETGKLTVRNFGQYLTCSGNIEPTPRSLAMVNAPMGGFVRNISLNIGDKVSRGQTLATLENPELLKIQEDFLITLGNYEFLREEYKRKAELNLENAASLKEEQQARANLKTTEARMLSLREQLEFLGIDPHKIEEKGMTSSISLIAPITGYISMIHVNTGKYVESTQSIIEIVDPENLHLHLRIFEKDIASVKKGQTVRFSMLADAGKKYRAEIYSLGHSINPTDHTITVHARLIDKEETFIPGIFVNAEIMTSKGNYTAIPGSGVVKGTDVSYIFLSENNRFQRIPVKTGMQDSIYLAIIDPPHTILDANIVTKGAYFLNAALESREEE